MIRSTVLLTHELSCYISIIWVFSLIHSYCKRLPSQSHWSRAGLLLDHPVGLMFVTTPKMSNTQEKDRWHLEVKHFYRRDKTWQGKRDNSSSQSFALSTLGLVSLSTSKISEHFSEPFCNFSGAFRQRKSEDCFIALIVGNLILRAGSLPEKENCSMFKYQSGRLVWCHTNFL